MTTSKLGSWIFWNQRTVPVPVFFFSDGWHVWSSRTVTLAYFLGSFAPHHFPPHSWCVRPFGRMFCWQNYQFRYVWVDITWRFFHSGSLNRVEICHTWNDLLKKVSKRYRPDKNSNTNILIYSPYIQCLLGNHGAQPYLEDHPRTCKWLVTPSYKAIWKGNNPSQGTY